VVHRAAFAPCDGAEIPRKRRFFPWHVICEVVPMTPEQIELVQRTWRAVLPVGDTAAELFYGKLFSLDPAVRGLFKDDMVEQGRNLTAMISVAVGSLSKPERIRLAVRQLGERHAGYGVERRHYELVGIALIWALEKCLGEAFSPEVKAAWLATYAFLSEAMQDGARVGLVHCNSAPNP
jgi:hemoglobin-like flavoprotein